MLKKLLLGLAVLSSISTAQAGIVTFADRTSFDAAGVIAFNNDFEHWDASSGFAGLADPYAELGVSYTSTNNIIVGVNSGYTLDSNHLANDLMEPLAGTLDGSGQFDMFALDVGTYGITDAALTLYTNLGSYLFEFVAPDPGLEALDFYGFKLDAGEYFTAFDIATVHESYVLMIDNVTLANTAIAAPVIPPVAVSEPMGIALLGLGLLGLVAVRKRTLR